MITAPIAKALLEHDPKLIPVILGCLNHFEIAIDDKQIAPVVVSSCGAIDDKQIAPQRMTTPPQARQFKTLGAAYSYLRNFLDYRGDVHIRLVDEPTTGTGDIL